MTENEISNILIGDAIYVHRIIGPGILGLVYEECLVYKLIKSGLYVERQKPISLVFERQNLNADFDVISLLRKK